MYSVFWLDGMRERRALALPTFLSSRVSLHSAQISMVLILVGICYRSSRGRNVLSCRDN
jgi:hypothetical protein